MLRRNYNHSWISSLIKLIAFLMWQSKADDFCRFLNIFLKMSGMVDQNLSERCFNFRQRGHEIALLQTVQPWKASWTTYLKLQRLQWMTHPDYSLNETPNNQEKKVSLKPSFTPSNYHMNIDISSRLLSRFLHHQAAHRKIAPNNSVYQT